MKTLLDLSMLMLCVTPVHAELYKWVDEQGKVHYSDQPAKGKTKSESKLNIPNPSSASPASEEVKTWQEKDLEFKKRQASAAEKAAKEQKEAQEAKTKRENCDNAKLYLAQLESIAPVYTYDPTTGRRYLNDAQRAEAIASAKKSVAEWCK